jgi:hypothetical protein
MSMSGIGIPKNLEEYEAWTREWTFDDNGERIRVGLSKDETIGYESLKANSESGRGGSPRFLELWKRHERARREMVLAEIEKETSGLH